MTGSVLANLAASGIIERPRNRGVLRVTPRFYAHTQATALRATTPQGTIATALASWPEGHHSQHAIDVVTSIMDKHGLNGPTMMPVAA